MTDVTWLPVAGVSFHEVSSQGEVRSLDRWIKCKNGVTRFVPGQLLSPYQDRQWGYFFLKLQKDGSSKRRSIRVHKMVCESFHGPAPSPSHMVRHLNGDPTDNRPENLRWGTGTENQLDRIAHGRNEFANQTHCKWGHEFTADNTYRYKNSRHCKACNKVAQSKRRKTTKRENL